MTFVPDRVDGCIDPANQALRVNVVAGGSSGGGGAVTVADGADVTQGTSTDASGANTVLGQLKKIASAGGSAVSIADGSDVAQGTTTDVAWVSGSGTVVALLKKIAGSGGAVTVSNFPATQPVSGSVSVSNFPATQPVSGTVSAGVPALGQALSASSLPVVLPAAQITTLTPPAAITGYALETGGNLASIKTDVDKIPAQGQALAAASMPVVLTAAQLITLTPPAVFGGIVTQATGSNLHVAVDSAPSTAVTNAGTFAVQAAATLNAETTKVIGTVNVAAAQTIAVSQATAANLNATVTLAAASGVRITGNAGATLDAAVGTLPTNNQAVISVPTTGAGAACTAKFINASGAAAIVKASAGNLYGFSLTNGTAAIAFIEFFNIATAPTLGTTAVVFCVGLPASANVTIYPGQIALMNFTTGIGFAVTTGENGVTAAAVTGMIFYN